jgi:hypothetical protein
MLQTLFKNAVSDDLLFEISRGAIPGFSRFTITGDNSAVGTTLETIWDNGGIYTYPASATKLKIASTSANDTAEGTGARSTFIAGLDANGYWQHEIVPLAGQAGAESTLTYSRLNVAFNYSVGSGGYNAGRITIGTGTPVAGVLPTVYGVIDGTVHTHDNMMKQAIFSVPKGYRMYYLGSVLGVEAAKELILSIYFQKQEMPMLGGGELILYQSPLQFVINPPMVFDEMTNCEARGFVASGDAFARINLDIILERVDESVPFIFPNFTTGNVWA